MYTGNKRERRQTRYLEAEIGTGRAGERIWFTNRFPIVPAIERLAAIQCWKSRLVGREGEKGRGYLCAGLKKRGLECSQQNTNAPSGNAHCSVYIDQLSLACL
jgi:hypothetical protein